MMSERNRMRSLLFEQSDNTMFATYVTDRILRTINRTDCMLTITDSHILLSASQSCVRFHAEKQAGEWGVSMPCLLVEQQSMNSPSWELRVQTSVKRHIDACFTSLQTWLCD